MKHFDAVIVSGGDIEDDFALDFIKTIKAMEEEKKVLMIAADHGLDFFLRNGLLPDVAVGDFDSATPEAVERLQELEKNPNLRIVRLKPEKDDSDTQSALMLALREGRKSVLLLGCLGSRLDHMLANLGLLLLADSLGAEAVIADACNYVCLLKKETVLWKSEQFGDNVSFFPLGGAVEGLTLTGFHYPLRDHLLKLQDSGLTVSNVIEDERAEVHYRSGNLVMIQSKDR